MDNLGRLILISVYVFGRFPLSLNWDFIRAEVATDSSLSLPSQELVRMNMGISDVDCKSGSWQKFYIHY